MSRFFILILTLTASLSFGAPKPKGLVISDAPVVLARGAARRLFVSGFSGGVTFVPASKSSSTITIKVTRYMDASPDSNLDTLRQLIVRTAVTGDTVEVHALLPPSRPDWLKWTHNPRLAPQAHLEISAPDNMRLDTYWTHGDVKVAGWVANVLINGEEGRLVAEDIGGDVILRTMLGPIKVDNVKGTVNIENFSGPVSTAGVTGKLVLRTFSGETKIKKIVGPMFLSTQKAVLTTQDTNGSMDVQTGAGAVKISEHRGALKGNADSGAVHARILGPVTARLSSVSGPVSLVIPRGSQAHVSLVTDKRNIVAPSSLEKKTSSSGKLVGGDLGGSEPGSIHMSSESGDITLKTM